jgi:hypothetical protein
VYRRPVVCDFFASCGLNSEPSVLALPDTAKPIFPGSMTVSFKSDTGPGTVPAVYVVSASRALPTMKLVLPLDLIFSQTSSSLSPSHCGLLAPGSLVTRADRPESISRTRISLVLECDSNE